jgi:hypothetical protein
MKYLRKYNENRGYELLKDPGVDDYRHDKLMSVSNRTIQQVSDIVGIDKFVIDEIVYRGIDDEMKKSLLWSIAARYLQKYKFIRTRIYPLDIEIYEYEDEWFELSCTNLRDIASGPLIYWCDQMEGMTNFLNDIKNNAINEGIFSKAAELLRYNRKADQLIKKYIKMIYDDYNKNKDLFRVSIVEDSEYIDFKYMITTGDLNNVQLGNRDENAITIELTFIENTFKWSSDTTQARLEVRKFKSYQGDLLIVGRNIKTGEIIENENGIKSKDAISYVNTPSGEVSKIIKFFIREFKSKYPTMSKYYGARSILKIDTKLRDKMESDSDKKRMYDREKYEEERERKKQFILSKLDTMKMKEEDIIDFFIEVEDEVDIQISHERSIYIDRTIYTAKIFKSLKDPIVDEFSLDGLLNKNKLEFDESDIPLKKNIPYHKLVIGLLDADYSPDEFKKKIDKVINRLKFGLKLEASEMMIDKNPFSGDHGLHNSYLSYECNDEISRMFTSKKAVYIIYLSEI